MKEGFVSFGDQKMPVSVLVQTASSPRVGAWLVSAASPYREWHPAHREAREVCRSVTINQELHFTCVEHFYSL